MVPLSIDEVGAAYYTGNCHKWISAPKGAAILHVRKDRQDRVRPVSISHGANSPRTDRSRYRIEFDWTGTIDPTPWLAIPAAIDFFEKLIPGGWSEVMKRNRALALKGRRILCEALKTAEPAPEEMIGSMSTVVLPAGRSDLVLAAVDSDPLHHELMNKFGIEVPVWPWPAPPQRVLRISAHLYNDESEYRQLASALGELLGS
jgi:isopenicillin-N epimerase